MKHLKEKDLTTEQKEALNKVLDELVVVTVFHRTTLNTISKEIKRRHTNPFVDACIENFGKIYPNIPHSKDDFGIIVTNFQTKNIVVNRVD